MSKSKNAHRDSAREQASTRQKSSPRWLHWVVCAAAVSVILGVLWLASDINQYVSLRQVQQWQGAHPLLTLLVFCLLFFLMGCFSLPGSGPLTFAAGAVFGFWVGVVVVSFISAIAATAGMLLARGVLRDWVEKRYATSMAKIHAGFDRDGPLYLFSLRLVPPLPYFVVNLAFGLTHMRALKFYWVTQLGMLPLVIVYVQAGTHLANLDGLSWHSVLSPEIVFTLVSLMLAPLLLKRALVYWQARRV